MLAYRTSDSEMRIAEFRSLLLTILVIILFWFGVHYWNNYINYPLPKWINQVEDNLVWLGCVSVGILIYGLSNRGHFNTIRTKVTDIEILVDALQELGLSVERNTEIRGSYNSRLRADLVAVLDGDCDIG